MNKQTKLALRLLDSVYQENIPMIKYCIESRASPSWIFNGFPILIHAVNIGNIKVVQTLMDAGADQVQEAFGYALEKEVGEVIPYLFYQGIVPKKYVPKPGFGTFPQLYAY